MPLGTRDILLIIRAKDEASRVIRGVAATTMEVDAAQRAAALGMVASGTALMSLGLGVAAVGVLGLNALNNWRKAAVDYNKTAALTLTQVDQQGVTLDQISGIGLRVADSVAAPLEQLQPALYDIFSSMNVSIADSEKILTGFAKSAVAGNVDVQTAGRQTIAVMNAFELSTDDLGRIQDVQFQLVRKGVGTYEEFASSIGRAIPPAARAGQTIETLSGVMAFLTRNGLSTSQAATSAGRAMELMANPKVIDRLNEMGISALNADGSFRQINEIAGDLGKSLEGLTDAEKARKLGELFAGAGNNVQARRFWDLAIRDFDSLNGLTDDMINSSGALQGAYDIMFNQPASQAQLLENNLATLRIEAGEQLIPIFNQFVETMLKWVQAFKDLDPQTKELVVNIVAITSAVLVASGALLTLGGAVKTLMGISQIAGGLGKLIGLFGVWGIVIIAIAAAAVLIYKNWDKLKPYWDKLWAFMKEKIQIFLDWFLPIWNEYWPKIQRIAAAVWDWLKKAWGTVSDAITTSIPIIIAYWDSFTSAIRTAWDFLVGIGNYLSKNFGPGFMRVFNAIKENAGPIIEDIIVILGRLWTWISKIFNFVLNIVQKVWPTVWRIISKYVNMIWSSISWFLELLWKVWTNVWDNVAGVVRGAWNIITSIIEGFINFVRGLLDIIRGIFTGDWGRIWDGVTRIVSSTWNMIIGVITGAWDVIWNILAGVGQALWEVFKGIWDVIWQTLQTVWDKVLGFLGGLAETVGGLLGGFWDTIQGVIDFFLDLGADILGWIGDVATTLWNKGVDFITGLLGGIVEKVLDVTNWFLNLGADILGWIGDVATWLWQKGKDFISGLLGGIVEKANDVYIWFTNIASDILEWIGDVALTLWGKGFDFIKGLWTGIKDEAEFVKTWVTNLPSKIIEWLGDLSMLLYDIGKSIITGLWNGMKNVFEDVKDWLTSLPTTIIGLKGPPAYDAIFLQDNGRLIMQGLRTGMQKEWGVTEAWLRTLSPAIRTQFGNGSALTGTAVPGTTQVIGMNIEYATFTSAMDVDAAASAVNSRLAALGV